MFTHRVIVSLSIFVRSMQQIAGTWIVQCIGWHGEDAIDYMTD